MTAQAAYGGRGRPPLARCSGRADAGRAPADQRAGAVVVTSNYGEAGAQQWYGGTEDGNGIWVCAGPPVAGRSPGRG